MKRFPLILLLAVSALIGCTNIDPNPNPDPDITRALADSILTYDFLREEAPDCAVVEEEYLTVEDMAALYDKDIADGDPDAEKYKNDFLERCREVEESLIADNGDNAVALIFKTKKFQYKTLNQKGDEITLSAFMGWAGMWLWLPFKGKFFVPFKQDHIVLSCPYTHTKWDECASKNRGGKEFRFMLHDNLFIMSDGQGFGDDNNHVQTYLDHNTHARQYFDALRSGMYLYAKDKEGGRLEKDWNLLVVGASQGAGDAIALHKFLDTHNTTLNLAPYYEQESTAAAANLLCEMYGVPKGTTSLSVPMKDSYRFKQSIVCCGPYCPAATMEFYQREKKLSYPCVIPLVIKSALACCKELSDKYDEEEFFSAEWNNNKKDFDDIYLRKTKDSDDLNIYIRQKLAVKGEKIAPEEFPLDRMLSADMLDPKSEISRDLMAWLNTQDLTSNWKPLTETYLYCSTIDEVVPYTNTHRLRGLFEDNGNKFKEIYTGFKHVGSCRFYMMGWWKP